MNFKQHHVQNRTQRETNKLQHLIHEANKMKKLDPSIDRTPASVTKYKSGGGTSYQVKLNQNK